jgi:geranylgeranyl diphosphate synthase type II
MNLKSLQESYLPQFETALENAIKFNLSDDRNILENAINYSVRAPGKRIRPLICLATEKSLTGAIGVGIPIGIAIELIHCYSLIHDDLPAMDDDDFRRGKPTCHKAFGEDMAILAGDVLNTYVFEYLASELPKYTSDKKTILGIKTLASHCGIHGMAGGQVLDLTSSHSTQASLKQLQQIHNLKTGALLKACFSLVSTIVIDDGAIQSTMKEIGHHFGLLFQIIDDILDETASLEALGKSPGKDAKQNKLTYVSLLGLDGAKNEAINHKNKGLELIQTLPYSAADLSAIFHYIFDTGVPNGH